MLNYLGTLSHRRSTVVSLETYPVFSWIPYLLVYRSTFYDQKVSPKKSPSTYARVINKDLTQAIQEISITIT